jgi:guanylate kinase
MSSKDKQFEIDEYNVFDSEIEVFTLNHGDEKTLFINREKFEKWLEKDGRLEWVYEYADYSGEAVQETGILPIEDYFVENSSYKIKEDLYDYITEKNLYDRMGKIFQNAFSHI